MNTRNQHGALFIGALLLLILGSALMSCRSLAEERAPDFLTPAPLPGFLARVYPAPNEVLSIENLGFEIDTQHPAPTVIPGVCIELVAGLLIEVGDEGLDSEDFIDRSTLLIDEEPISTNYRPFVISNGLDAVRVMETNEAGEIVRDENGLAVLGPMNAGGPFYICWKASLGIGLHDVDYSIVTSSGHVFRYRWQFYVSSRP